MWLPTTTIVAAEAEPVSLAEALEYLRIDTHDFDAQVQGFIAAARAHVENMTGTRLANQTVRMMAGSWDDLATLPAAPIISVTSLTYQDPAGAVQTLDADAYELVSAGVASMLRPAIGTSWPQTRTGSEGVITIEAVAGYGAAVPDTVRIAILQLVRGLMDGEDVDVSDWIVNDRVWL